MAATRRTYHASANSPETCTANGAHRMILRAIALAVSGVYPLGTTSHTEPHCVNADLARRVHVLAPIEY